MTFTLCIYKYIEIFYKFVFEETICRYMSYTIFRNENLFENELKNMLCKSHILSKKRTIWQKKLFKEWQKKMLALECVFCTILSLFLFLCMCVPCLSAADQLSKLNGQFVNLQWAISSPNSNFQTQNANFLQLLCLLHTFFQTESFAFILGFRNDLQKGMRPKKIFAIYFSLYSWLIYRFLLTHRKFYSLTTWKIMPCLLNIHAKKKDSCKIHKQLTGPNWGPQKPASYISWADSSSLFSVRNQSK